MSEKYCGRCLKNITYMYTYSEYCRGCKTRKWYNVPDYIPDSQVERYGKLREKNTAIL